MKFPRKLKIGGHTYKVILKESPVADGVSCPAYQDDEKMELVIDSRLDETARESSLIHEILHSLNCIIDHALLDSLAEQFYQVLHDNKLLR